MDLTKNNYDRDILQKLLNTKLGNSFIIKSVRNIYNDGLENNAKIGSNKGDFFVKWSYECPKDIFIREAESLLELSKTTNEFIRFPKVILTTECTDILPAIIVMEYLKPAYVTKHDDENLGYGIAEIHKRQNNKFGFYHNNYCDNTLQDNTWTENWIDFFSKNRINHIINLLDCPKGLIKERKIFDKLLTKLSSILNHNPTPAMTHGNLWSGNCLYTEKGPTLIDPASCYADREFDLALMAMFHGFSNTVWGAYQEAYPLQAEWQERNQIYKFYHLLHHQYLFGGSYINKAVKLAKKFI